MFAFDEDGRCRMQVQEGANNDEIVVDLCGLYGKSGWLSVTVRNDTYWFLSAPPTTHPPTIFCSFLDVFSLNQASKRCLNRQPDNIAPIADIPFRVFQDIILYISKLRSYSRLD